MLRRSLSNAALGRSLNKIHWVKGSVATAAGRSLLCNPKDKLKNVILFMMSRREKRYTHCSVSTVEAQNIFPGVSFPNRPTDSLFSSFSPPATSFASISRPRMCDVAVCDVCVCVCACAWCAMDCDEPRGGDSTIRNISVLSTCLPPDWLTAQTHCMWSPSHCHSKNPQTIMSLQWVCFDFKNFFFNECIFSLRSIKCNYIRHIWNRGFIICCSDYMWSVQMSAVTSPLWRWNSP